VGELRAAQIGSPDCNAGCNSNAGDSCPWERIRRAARSPLQTPAEANASAWQHNVWPAFEDASIQIEIDRVFHISDIQAAHDHMRANANVGKIVLQIADRLPDGVITH